MEDLRGEFANTALAARLRDGSLTRRHPTDLAESSNDDNALAKRAVAIADAMIAARSDVLPQDPTKLPSHSP